MSWAIILPMEWFLKCAENNPVSFEVRIWRKWTTAVVAPLERLDLVVRMHAGRKCCRLVYHTLGGASAGAAHSRRAFVVVEMRAAAKTCSIQLWLPGQRFDREIAPPTLGIETDCRSVPLCGI